MSVLALQLVPIGVLTALAFVAAIIDIRHFIIPDIVSIAIFASGLAASLLGAGIEPISALAGAIAGGALMWAVQAGFRLYRGYDGLGFGDVKFVAAGGAWTGMEGLSVALVIASVLALVVVLGRGFARGDHDRNRRIPFGPPLAAGIVIVAGTQTLTGIPILHSLIPL